MSNIDLYYAVLEEGRMNLMHLPPGAIAWLWDRPEKQVKSAEDFAIAANTHGNPVIDASLLKADQNTLLLKCEGGECFRVYPDGGYSYDDTPMDIGGCSSVLQGMDGGCGDSVMAPEMGMMEPEMDGGCGDSVMAPEMGMMEPEMGGDEMVAVELMTAEDSSGVSTGPAAGAGMGTGSPYVGQMGYDASAELENNVLARELGEFRIQDLPEDDLDILAEALNLK
jgi:hypothetical protein